MVSQEQLKKHKQSFNSLVPASLSTEYELVLIIFTFSLGCKGVNQLQKLTEIPDLNLKKSLIAGENS